MVRWNTYSIDIRRRVINFYNNGLKQIDICRNLQLHKSTVSRIIKRFVLTGSVVPIKNTGRPRKSSKRLDRKIWNISKANPFFSSTKILGEIEQSGPSGLSSRTVRRRLCEGGLNCFRPAKKPLLSKKNIKARLEFAQTHIHWIPQEWRKVVFSDESKFNLFRSDGIVHVRRPKGQRLNSRYTCPTVKHGGGSVLVWGCFSAFGIGPLHKIEGKMDRFMYRDILRNVLEPYTDDFMPLNFIFQHDNDPKHTSKLVKEWLEQQKIPVLKWPAQSPDLNPIENLWEILDQSLPDRKVKNSNELFTMLSKAWSEMDPSIINNLVNSMPKRMADVIKAKGYYTKY